MANGDKVKREPPFLPEGFEYIQRDWDRHGNARYFYRRPGYKLTRLRGVPGSDEFAIAYGAAIAAGPIAKATDTAAEQDTIGWLIGKYMEGFTFKARPRSIREAHGRALAKLRANTGTAKVRAFDRDEVEAILAKMMDTPAKANEWRSAMIDMFDWAVEKKHMASNPAAGIGKLKPKSAEGFHYWTPEELQAYRDKHPEGTMARLAVEIMYWCGFRASDVIRRGRPQMADGRNWKFTLHKNRNSAPVPYFAEVAPELIALLKRTPSTNRQGMVWDQIDVHVTRNDEGDVERLSPFLRNAQGKPFTRGAFTKAMRAWCDAAGLPQCTAHGVRKHGATEVAENEGTEQEIMAFLGHSDPGSARRYVANANRRKNADRANAKRRNGRPAAAEIVTPAIA